MKIGISSWTFPWAIGVKGYPVANPVTVLQLLERACAMGAQVVQIADNLPIDVSMLDSIRVAAGGMDVELGTRGTDPANLLRYLEYAVVLGARLIRTLPEKGDNEESLLAVLPAFERHQVLLALENYESLPSAELAGMVQRLNSPCLGVCLDTVNSLGALEMPDITVRTLAPYTVNLHVKDFEIRRVPYMMGFEVTGRPAGQGRLNLPAVLQELRPCGRHPNLVLEQWPTFSGSLEQTIAREAEWAQAGFNYLKSVLAWNQGL
jgi:3-oxoisoapionate decarboxylase